jgi:hypothetical protein
MRRNQRQRAAACLLALLAQAGFIALFMLSGKPHVEFADDESKRLIFVQPIEPLEIPPPPPRNNRDGGSTARAIPDAVSDRAQEVDRLATPAPPETSPDTPAPDAAPGIDWYGVMESSAKEIAGKLEDRERDGNPLDSKLKAMDIPERPHKAGDEERYPDGAVVTWLSERCYVLLDPAGSGPKPVRICKESTLAERRAEAHRKELEKAMMPEYLRRPLPKPPAAKANR